MEFELNISASRWLEYRINKWETTKFITQMYQLFSILMVLRKTYQLLFWYLHLNEYKQDMLSLFGSNCTELLAHLASILLHSR